MVEQPPVTSWFVLATCQVGAEQALKDEFLRDRRGFRLAFSRPGFVTFKAGSGPLPLSARAVASCFARAQALALDSVAGDQLLDLAARVWALAEVQRLSAGGGIRDLHVWQRDSARPGRQGFRPGCSPLAAEVDAALRQTTPLVQLRREQRRADAPSPTGAVVLDVVLIEPGHWWVGCHRADTWIARWPGGVLPVEIPAGAVSRAYGKTVEALAWSRLPLARGEAVVELGAAPGGACQALLDRGQRVIGVDPAEVNPVVAAHPDFTHIRKRAAEVRKRALKGVRWLTADMNVAPQFTLDAVESMVTHPDTHIRGLILTLKLLDWKLAAAVPEYLARVRSWGYRDVRARQLALAGQELSVVALRNRLQRRVLRRSGRAAGSPAARQ